MKRFLSRIFKRKTDVGDVGVNVGETDKMVSLVGREYYKQCKSVIDRWMEEYLERYKDEKLNDIRKKNKDIEQYNSVCPKCGKTFIVSRFIKKSDDVFVYNHCNDCTHEWEFKSLITEKLDPMEHTWSVVCLLDSLGCLTTATYNEFLYDSYEDMIKQKLDDIRQRYQEMIDTFPMEVLHYLGYKWANAYMTCTKEVFGKEYVTYENGEQYTGKFTPKIKEYLERLGVRTLSQWKYE
jgi:ssDNA-binding Zn-finger/Zn-ribbon topoisomerase 1